MCLIVTVRPYIQPPVRLIGLRRVRWVEGEGGAWRRIEKRRGGGKRGMGAWKRGDGVQRMQRQSWKTGRLLTSRRDTDKVTREERGEEADFDRPPWTVFCISKMAAHHLSFTNNCLQIHFSFTLLREKNVNDLRVQIKKYLTMHICNQTLLMTNNCKSD